DHPVGVHSAVRADPGGAVRAHLVRAAAVSGHDRADDAQSRRRRRLVGPYRRLRLRGDVRLHRHELRRPAAGRHHDLYAPGQLARPERPDPGLGPPLTAERGPTAPAHARSSRSANASASQNRPNINRSTPRQMPSTTSPLAGQPATITSPARTAIAPDRINIQPPTGHTRYASPRRRTP